MSLLLSSIGHLAGTLSSHKTALAPRTAGAGEFGAILDSAIHKVNALQTDASQSIQRFLNGDGEEVHNVALATQRAEIAFDLGVQVRNKVVSAYQEIMKMQL